MLGVCLVVACSVSTSIGALNEDGSAAAERPSNPDRSVERGLPFINRDGYAGNGFPANHDAWSGTSCNAQHSQSCEAGEFCDPDGPGCAGGDGHCKRVNAPEFCATGSDYSVVCGCDDVTYENDCRRVAAGVAVQYRGACK